MLVQLADLRFCTLMSLRPYVPAPLCPPPSCLCPYVVDRASLHLRWVIGAHRYYPVGMKRRWRYSLN